ncbi:hypothetical protein [Pontibacter pamirensis]|uniref:hypothetical protein n=1 Tax=Pontibacter pamirensis TaxID=2562824 RepID=UPI001389D65E|nr:hypothetical protein [Pontibacter pamirensis]
MVLLYADELVELEHAAIDDILFAELKETRPLPAPEFKRVIMSVVTGAREHQVKKMLLDFSKNALDMTGMEYRSIMAQLTVGLMRSPAQKVARMATTDMEREQLFRSVCDEIHVAIKQPIEFLSFGDRAEALQWLKR